MIKEIKTEKFEGLAVLVPDEGKRFIADWKFLIVDLCTPSQKMIPIPEGEFQVLGKATELTDKQCAEIVPQMKDSGYPFEFESYHDTFDTFMQSIRAYSVNPLDNDDNVINMYPEWQEAQVNTGTWLILKKL